MFKGCQMSTAYCWKNRHPSSEELPLLGEERGSACTGSGLNRNKTHKASPVFNCINSGFSSLLLRLRHRPRAAPSAPPSRSGPRRSKRVKTPSSEILVGGQIFGRGCCALGHAH